MTKFYSISLFLSVFLRRNIVEIFEVWAGPAQGKDDAFQIFHAGTMHKLVILQFAMTSSANQPA